MAGKDWVRRLATATLMALIIGIGWMSLVSPPPVAAQPGGGATAHNEQDLPKAVDTMQAETVQLYRTGRAGDVEIAL